MMHKGLWFTGAGVVFGISLLAQVPAVISVLWSQLYSSASDTTVAAGVGMT